MLLLFGLHVAVVAYGLPPVGPIHPEISIRENMGLVHYMANKYQDKCRSRGSLCSRRTHKEELIQIGTITLWNCINKFDRSRGIQFSTYTCRAMHNAMMRYARPRNHDAHVGRFSIVHANTLHSRQPSPEDAVESKLLEETLDALQEKGYSVRDAPYRNDHYYVRSKLSAFRDEGDEGD